MRQKIYTFISPKVEVRTPFVTCVYLCWVKDSPLLNLFEHEKTRQKAAIPKDDDLDVLLAKCFLGDPFLLRGWESWEKKTYGKDQKSDLGNHGIHHRGRDLSLECFQMKLRC